ADPALASKMAERLRIAVEARLVKSPTSDELLEVTVSIGIAMARADDTIDILINRADECLYQAKMAGRNCVVVEGQNRAKTDAA
ncbi:diguanylate cyclase, partial [Aeromonas sp. HMWF015]